MIIFNNPRVARLLNLLIVLTLLAASAVGCAVLEPSDAPPIVPDAPDSTDTPDVSEDDIASLIEEFDSFLDELFVEMVTSDSITLNFTLSNPSAFGIEDIVPTFGEVPNYERARQNRERSIESAERLRTFNRSLLRPDQQVIFDTLNRSYEISHSLEFREEHIYYLGRIFPYSGIQVMLPILLTEFNFRTIADFEIYFALLEDTPRFFAELIEFERERSRRGFFLSAENVDSILEHLDSFLANREDNFLLEIIDDKIYGFEGLSEEQRNEYRERNRELVLNYFLPAYDDLASALSELRGVGVRDGGLASLPDGEELSLILLQQSTDSDMSLSEMQSTLANEFDRVQSRLFSLFSENPHLMDMFFAGMLGNIPFDSPENYMQIIEDAMAQDFPVIQDLNYTLIEVHESLQEHIGPAFFIIPAIDDFTNNSIYINPSRIDDSLSLFTILAHEGFPGHMYQFAYFFRQSPHPIRNWLTGIGYTEGWATYVELKSYFWAGLDEPEAEILSLSRLLDLLFFSIIDININAFGWNIDDLNEFLSRRGMALEQDVINNIFHRVTGDPFDILPYTIGYIELRSLMGEAQDSLGEDFALLDFHEFFLDFGPAPFSLIREHYRLHLDSIEINPSTALSGVAHDVTSLTVIMPSAFCQS